MLRTITSSFITVIIFAHAGKVTRQDLFYVSTNREDRQMGRKYSHCDSCCWDRRLIQDDGSMFLACDFGGMTLQLEIITKDLDCPYHRLRWFRPPKSGVIEDLTGIRAGKED